MEENSETTCVLKKIEQQIELPIDTINALKQKGKNFVAIIPNDLRKIVMFPTNADKAIYTKILIKKKSRLDDKFFVELRKRLSKYGLKTLYTTGVCYSQEECFWEGIFEDNGLKIESFRSDLKEIDSVVSVKIKVLEE